MPDIRDGSVVHIRGSAPQPYQLKNVGGVLSCSCPAWRNQALPLDRRTCKHLRNYRGEAAEAARLGTTLPPLPAVPLKPQPPPLLLAESWDGVTDPTGWLLSEKLDGVRAWWDGQQFRSRQGHRYHAPAWFTAGLPLVPLDGELWRGRGQFAPTVSVVRRADGGAAWRALRFVVFDAPGEDGPFPARLTQVQLIMDQCRPPFAQAHPHAVCRDRAYLEAELDRVLALGGEGLMLRDPCGEYVAGRSATLQKVKRFQEREAVVVGHVPGQGRHRGRFGALVAELPSGVRFQVGSGLTDADRRNPPAVGSLITVRYPELTARGVPRFPVFARVRTDLAPPDLKGVPMPCPTTPRRFEFVGGRSAKFWEIWYAGSTVTVHFGRRGAAGQTRTTTCPDAAAAARHAATLVQEKLTKGYVAVA